MPSKERQRTKNDVAWEQLFDELDIVKAVEEHGVFEISATQINKVRQSRLMAKFDQVSVLPEIFYKYKLSILPLSRSHYIIGHFATHFKLEDSKNDKLNYISKPFPSDIESIDYTNLYSEAAALACAYNTGIIDDISGEPTRFTLLGRMSTGDFSFRITNSLDPHILHDLTVSNSQCEIDGGFESDNCLLLIEAKNVSLESFLIRQLYYPYRLWTTKIQNKEVIPVLMIFSDDVFTFYIFSFEDSHGYNSLKLRETRRFKIAPEDISLEDVSRIFSQTTICDEPAVTFPQADRFDNVLNLLNFLKERPRTKPEISEQFSIVSRQVNYYTDAGQYLGLVTESKDPDTNVKIYLLTEKAEKLLLLRHRKRYLEVMKLIFEHKIFHEAFLLMSQSGVIPSVQDVAQIIAKNNTNITGTTVPRRAQTVISWIRWIWSQIVDYD